VQFFVVLMEIKKNRNNIKILILGISGSGKSTFTKQMKIIYTEGFTDEERLSYVEIVRTNVIVGIRELSEQANARGLDISEKNRKYMRYFRENDPLELKLIQSNVINKVKCLWEDPTITEAWEACRNYQIQVSQMDFFMANLDRITGAEYIPTDDDIVRARQRTAGAYITRFNAFKSVWEIIDVGGQAPERKKWMAIIDQQLDLTSIIYFAALDEYNMESSEEPGKTKMEVSMRVFAEIMKDVENFNKCSILFMNKIDLFRDKITSEKGFNEYKEKFPDFEDFLNDEYVRPENLEEDEDECFDAALTYIEMKFKELALPPNNTNLVVFKTCAIHTNEVESVFNAMKDHIFLQRMSKSGIVF